MIPQGSVLLNTTQFASLTTSVNQAGSCAELQSVVADAIGSINAVKSAISAELALLSPVLELLTNPAAALTDIANWIEKFISGVLTPYLTPTTTYASQLIALEAEIAKLLAAIEARAAAFENCVVSVAALV